MLNLQLSETNVLFSSVYEVAIQKCEDFPVDGTWLTWGNWQDDATCGVVLSRRTRQCQQPENGGKTCPGSKSQLRSVDTGITCQALTSRSHQLDSCSILFYI